MTKTDLNAIGPDGTVRLRCYLPSADVVWFFARCQGRKSCGYSAPISVRAAIRVMGSGEATIGELKQRLRCNHQCGNRQISVTVQPDRRTAEVIERCGPASETLAGLGQWAKRSRLPPSGRVPA
jgi:hypothetical protein